MAPASAPARCRSSSPSATPSGTTRPARATNGENGLNDYGTADCTACPTRATAIARAGALNAHVMGIAGHGAGASGNAKARMLATARRDRRGRHAGRLRPVGTRPAKCAITQCCTGELAGAGEAPQANGTCPLVVHASTTRNGNGVGERGGVGHRRAGQRPQVRHPRRGQRRRSDDRRQLHAQAGAEPVGHRAGGDVHHDGADAAAGQLHRPEGDARRRRRARHLPRHRRRSSRSASTSSRR